MLLPSRANHERDLAVGLQPHESVNDMHAFAFQRSGPMNVALFVKAGFQFNEYRDLFAILQGFEQAPRQSGNCGQFDRASS